MSNAIFPTLLGIDNGVIKEPEFSTLIQRSASLRETRISLAASPLYNFDLPFSFLRVAYQYQELQTLMGFVNQRFGSFDSFLYSDPEDNFAENVQIGIGDGVTASFPLFRSAGGFVERIWNPDLTTASMDPLMWAEDPTTPMWDVDPSTLMWLGGSGLGPFTISFPGGVVTFTTSPPVGVPIYWSGFYYYRCRFTNDKNPFKMQMKSYWDNQSLQFCGSLDDKIS